MRITVKLNGIAINILSTIKSINGVHKKYPWNPVTPLLIKSGLISWHVTRVANVLLASSLVDVQRMKGAVEFFDDSNGRSNWELKTQDVLDSRSIAGMHVEIL